MKTIAFNKIKNTSPLFIVCALFVTVFLFSSCKKFLDIDPKNTVSDENSITDSLSAKVALNGTYSLLANNGSYNQLSNTSYYGSGFNVIGFLSGDNVNYSGPQTVYSQFTGHSLTADNIGIGPVWNGIYATINSANHVITKVPELSNIKPALQNQLTGEAYFIRALSYFDLARAWGGIQLVTTPSYNQTDHLGIPRSSLAATYAQVLKDLDAAENLLLPITNRIRATKKTVWALKARYYLYQKDWTNAEIYSTNLLSDASYKLISPFGAWFQNNATATAESVFELAYSIANPGTLRGNFLPQTLGGNKIYSPSSALIALLTDTSKSNFGRDRSSFLAKSGSTFYGNLYYRNPATDPVYVIRIAELYLIRAEARAQLGNFTGATEDLNAVRKRAGLNPTAAITGEEILKAISDERRVEFPFEADRWFDLVRTGRAASTLGITDPNKFLLPVPIDQLNADPSLTQNPGY